MKDIPYGFIVFGFGFSKLVGWINSTGGGGGFFV